MARWRRLARETASATLPLRSETEPGSGRNRLRGVADLEVEQRPFSFITNAADTLSCRNLVGDLHVDAREVPAHAVVVIAMVDDDEPAIRTIAIGVRHAAAVD